MTDAGAPPRGRLSVAAVVLAAGASRRMEGKNKLLVEVDGVPLIRRVVDAVLASPVSPVVVVLGHDAEAVHKAIGPRPVRFAFNASAADGMSTSLVAGLDALDGGDGVDGALVCLGDMPWVRAEHLAALCAAFDASDGNAICVPFHEGRRGNPVLWPSAYFPELLGLSGDTGGRALLEKHAAAVTAVPISDAGVVTDIDTPEDLRPT